MALGARQNQVIRLIVGSGMRLSLLGLGIGVAGAVVLGRLMHATLYGVQVLDLFSLMAVTVLLFMAALLACLIPARRSATIDPVRYAQRVAYPWTERPVIDCVQHTAEKPCGLRRLEAELQPRDQPPWRSKHMKETSSFFTGTTPPGCAMLREQTCRTPS